MKQRFIGQIQAAFLTLIAMFIGMISSFSQVGNSSYNANSVPISGSYSVAFGPQALSNTNTGYFNTAIGNSALNKNTSANNNTAVGYQALSNNTIGASNTAQGAAALYSNTSGQFNTAQGVAALYSNTTASGNTATGFGSLYTNTTGSGNAAVGYQTLYQNTIGTNNVAFGSNSLQSNTIGYGNTAIGTTTLFGNVSGDFNTAIGLSTLVNNTTGASNSAIGIDALHTNTTGSHNIATGFETLFSNIAGSYNIAIGDSAGHKNNGHKNMFLGVRAGYFENVGSNKMYLANDSNKTLLYGDFSTGQVLMGKGQPSGYVFKGTRTLNVLGGLLIDSIRVALSQNWSDNVFDKTYQLPSLKEVEQYIAANKHLPGIPSEKEVKQNGIELGEMNAKLLAKIEELTLYLLQQQKQIDELKKQVGRK